MSELKTDYEKQLFWTAQGLIYAASSIMRSFGNEENAQMFSEFLLNKAKEAEDLLHRVRSNQESFDRETEASGL